MFTKFRVLFVLLAIGGVLCGPPALAADSSTLAKVDAVQCPPVKLSHWQASTQEEKLAFLFGFTTMLELEKEWQGAKPLPIGKSTVGSWVKGLTGVTLGQMSTAVDAYFADHPGEGERQVVEVLGLIYVRPSMTAEVRKEAAARYSSLSGKK